MEVDFKQVFFGGRTSLRKVLGFECVHFKYNKKLTLLVVEHSQIASSPEVGMNKINNL